jgi:ABC-type dipeptide/oligopeptide/nickel transport system permease component
MTAAFAIFIYTSMREKRRAAEGLPRHSVMRLLFAALGGGLALFSGGCGTLLGIAEALRPPSGSADDFMDVGLVMILSLPPFLVGALIWWLSMRHNSG